MGKPGGEGIDGISCKDRLGLDFVYLQAKEWLAHRPEPRIAALEDDTEADGRHLGNLG